MFFIVIALALLVALYFVVSLGNKRQVPELGSASWMTLQTGLPPHLASDAALAGYARRTRRWRTAGVAGAFVGSVVWGVLDVAGDGQASVNTLVALFIGWFGAGVVPELFVRNRAPSEHRAATLAPRSPSRYLTLTAKRWLTASYVGIVAALVVISLATTRSTPARQDIVMIVTACAALTAIAGLAVWRIATRHQPATGPDDVAIDEAIRALATTRVVSGWTVLNFIAVIYLGPNGDFENAGVSNSVFATIGSVGALAGWAWVPTRIHRGSTDRPASAVSA